jgi:5-(carboxyamino)imidazole ribonucleotide synthase
MDGSITSQFEQTIRAILNLPLGSTKIKAHKAQVEMINILGDDINNLEKYYKNPKAKIYIYGKENSKKSEKRKLGHINLL